MERKEYNKLVRDKIPEILKAKGVSFGHHIATDSEFEEKLFEKLIEESREVTEAKTIEELADPYEVLEAIKKLKNFTDEEIQKIKNEKVNKRGGFQDRVILEYS